MDSLSMPQVGQRVQTPHGSGTVIGFEKFSNDGMTSEIVSKPPELNSRVVIKLDPDHTWPFKDKDYYIHRLSLEPI